MRRPLRLATLAFAALALAACAPIEAAPTPTTTASPPTQTTSAGPSPVAAACTPSAPAATALADGPRTATIPDDGIHPVAEDPRPTLPVTVPTADGAEVTVSSADRIVAVDLYGTLGEIVYSLGLGGNVVGRDVSTGFPEAAAVPVVTQAGHSLNVEAILGLDPTVILTDDSILTDATRTQLAQSGVPVVTFAPERTLASVGPRITAVAHALGVDVAGAALAERTDDEICSAREAVPAQTGSPVVAFLYLRGSALKLLFGPGSGADQLITAVGGVDAGTAIGLDAEYRPVTNEALITAAPAVYLVMTDGLESAGGLDAMLGVPGVGQTPAGEARRVIDMDGSELLAFGPRTGATIRALTQALYG